MTCRDCQHARFDKTASGRIRRNTPGICMSPFTHPEAVLPRAIVVTIRKVAIWPDMYDGCPTYKPTVT